MRTPTFSLSMIFLLSAAPCSAQSGDNPAFYDKDAITGASEAFKSVAGALEKNYLPLEREISRTDSLLAELDLSLALSNGAVDGAHHKLWTARLNERSAVFGMEFEAMQARIGELEEGFELGFQGALDRALLALSAEGIEPAPCAARPAGMGGIGPGFAQGSGGCDGEDLSARIAAMWDKDPILKAHLDEVIGKAWPTVTTYNEQSAAVTTSDHVPGSSWLSPAAFAGAIPEAAEYIDTVDRMAETARRELRATYAGLNPESERFKEQSDIVRERARGIRTFTESSKADAGKDLWAAVERARRKGKKAGWSGVVVCLNPSGWGGCEGNDHTDDVAATVNADKKLRKALTAGRTRLESPDVSVP